VEKTLNGETRLPEVWQRLETICRRLWDADAPAAVDLQALIEEFKGETHRVEQTLIRMHKAQEELRETVTKEVQRGLAEEIRTLQVRLKNAQDRIEVLEAGSARKEERIQELLKDIAAKEATNLEFHEKFLASTAEQDEARAKKMENFYKELTAKDAQLEAGWERRHAALEAEHKQQTEALKKRHSDLLDEMKSRAAAIEEHYSKRERELEAAQESFRADRETWDATRISEAKSLSKRKEELSLQADNLASEYKKKQTDLQRLKDSMQSELAEVVRQYQVKTRGTAS
jgi:chromosome segregation ATPase